jgi:hypothetical protein
VTAGGTTTRAERKPVRGSSIASGAAALMLMGFMFVAAVAVLEGASPSTGSLYAREAPVAGVSLLAQRDIPAPYLRLYQQAAQRFGLDWAVLAGIGKVECDHGRDPDPSCTKEGAVNPAGAGGPMQFIAATWRVYARDGDGDGKLSRWDPADAIYSAANYLRASGAPADYHHALLAYNHAESYVAEVLNLAVSYRGAAAPAAMVAAGGEESEGRPEWTSSTPIRFVAGERALLAPEDGRVALIPIGVPSTVQAMVIAGNELQELPYGPGGHPDPRGAPEEDCSSTVNYVLYRSGVRPIGEIVSRNPLAQDYTRWGAPGAGRWVTIYATTRPDHVFAVIAGLRLDTSHDGTDVGPNRNEDGPRWRILDHIPTWARWSVRHPPGL